MPATTLWRLAALAAFLAENAMIYGDLGAGVAGGAPVYAFGAGVEMAMTDALSVRGELRVLAASVPCRRSARPPSACSGTSTESGPGVRPSLIASPRYDCLVLTTKSRIEAVRAEWDALAISVPSPMAQCEWTLAAVDTIEAERDLHLVTLRDHGDLIAVAPLMRQRQGLVSVLRPIAERSVRTAGLRLPRCSGTRRAARCDRASGISAGHSPCPMPMVPRRPHFPIIRPAAFGRLAAPG